MRPLEDGMGVKKIEAVLFEVQKTFSFIRLKVHFGLCTPFVSIVKSSLRRPGWFVDPSQMDLIAHQCQGQNAGTGFLDQGPYPLDKGLRLALLAERQYGRPAPETTDQSAADQLRPGTQIFPRFHEWGGGLIWLAGG